MVFTGACGSGQASLLAAAMPFPPKGDLAKAWDANAFIREQMRAHSKLLTWPSAASTGVANKTSLKLNRFQIQILIEMWTSISNSPKSPPIWWIQQEACYISTCQILSCCTCLTFMPSHAILEQVKEVHIMLAARVDSISMVVDEWGTKRLVSYCLRAYRTGMVSFRDLR